jgi:hypothetical protein
MSSADIKGLLQTVVVVLVVIAVVNRVPQLKALVG